MEFLNNIYLISCNVLVYIIRTSIDIITILIALYYRNITLYSVVKHIFNEIQFLFN